MLSGLCTIRFALGFRQRLCGWEKSLHLPFTRTPMKHLYLDALLHIGLAASKASVSGLFIYISD